MAVSSPVGDLNYGVRISTFVLNTLTLKSAFIFEWIDVATLDCTCYERNWCWIQEAFLQCLNCCLMTLDIKLLFKGQVHGWTHAR